MTTSASHIILHFTIGRKEPLRVRFVLGNDRCEIKKTHTDALGERTESWISTVLEAPTIPTLMALALKKVFAELPGGIDSGFPEKRLYPKDVWASGTGAHTHINIELGDLTS